MSRLIKLESTIETKLLGSDFTVDCIYVVEDDDYDLIFCEVVEINGIEFENDTIRGLNRDLWNYIERLCEQDFTDRYMEIVADHLAAEKEKWLDCEKV